jgi:hypothetical protein
MNITRTQLYEKVDSLPEALQNIIYSEEVFNSVWGIANTHHLSEDRFSKLAATTAFLIAGFVHPEDLVKEVTSSLGVDKRIAESLEKEIRVKILYPIAEELRKTHGFHIEGAPVVTPQPTQPTTPPASQITTPTPLPQTPTASPEGTILKPRVQKEEPAVEPLATPFVLHQHEDIETIQGTTGYAEGFSRPSFHTSAGYEPLGEENTTPVPKAHLELGAQSVAQEHIELRTARVGREKAKIIHYSAPEGAVDPFSGKPGAAAMPTSEAPTPRKSDVPPSNVVNLKDLPK